MRLITWLSAFFLLPLLSAQSLDSLPTENPTEPSLREAILKGSPELYARSFFLSTVNRGELTDYYAWVNGLGLAYQTQKFKGFSARLNTFYTWNTVSSDLSLPDPLTNAPNRYEIGLVDVMNPSRRHFIRMEEFWLRHEWRGWRGSFGRMVLETPLVNPQDGRMRPSAQEGLWLEYEDTTRHYGLKGGWFYRMGVRSTVDWVSTAQSMGQYPMGLTVDGQRAAYLGQIQTPGLAIVQGHYAHKGLSVEAWNYSLPNVGNWLFTQTEYKHKIKAWQLLAGFQFLQQNALGEGGHSDPLKRYIEPGSQTQVYSVRLQAKRGLWTVSGNYSHFGAQSRFLFPREWGRDPFYTFLPRERNEGYADVHAASIRLSFAKPKFPLRFMLGYGHYYLPEPDLAAKNKYGIPAYRQFNAQFTYKPQGRLRDFTLDFWYVFKGRLDRETDYNLRYIHNKVDMHQFNLILNYRLSGISA